MDEPITALLIRNALALVEKQTAHKFENGKLQSVGFAPKEIVQLFDEQKPASDADFDAAIAVQFDRVLRRKPTDDELARFTTLLHKNIADAGREAGVQYSLAAVFLLPEAIFRSELGSGTPDEQGRVRACPREIAFALAYALTDKRPDGWLLIAAEKGELDTREGVAAAVRKMLDDPKLEKPRILRFFREYFGYDKASEVFKDDKANPEHDARALVEDTDRLVRVHSRAGQGRAPRIADDEQEFRRVQDRGRRRRNDAAKSWRSSKRKRQKNPEKFKNKKPPKIGRSVYEAYNLTDFPDQQPVELPPRQRAGILTQPAWLVAYSKSDDNHAIHRGKWVRERLLGGVVPDIPITVDAQLPNAPEKTLRERMTVTQEEYCWKCHQLMNDVGLPFELYDHFGRFRTTEPVLDPEATAKNVDKKGKPLGPVTARSSGRRHAADSSTPATRPSSGDVQERGRDSSAKLAGSERVEQVFVRHAFRYWLGPQRNARRRRHAAGGPQGVPRERRQHEGADRRAADERFVPVPRAVERSRPLQSQCRSTRQPNLHFPETFPEHSNATASSRCPQRI